MNKKLLCIMTFFILIFLVGCSSKEQKIPLEDIGLVGIMAFDYVNDDTMTLSVAIPQYSPEAQKNIQIFSVSTELVSKGIVEIEQQSDKKIALNQLRVVLINEEFARKGDVYKAIQYLYRNAEVGNKVLIAIVKEKGEDLLKEEYPDKPSIIFYLSDLLQPSLNTAFNPNTNIHDFIYMMTNPVYDLITPYLNKKDGKIEIEGIALFKNKHFYEVLKPEEALIIQALQGQKNLAPLELELNQGHGREKLMLDLIKSTVDMKSNKNFESPKLTISLYMKGTISEYKGSRQGDLDSKKGLAVLEQDVNKEVEEDIKKFIEKLKEQKVDPIGLSEKFRMYYNGKWKGSMKEDIISKLEVEVNVTTAIIGTGTLR